MVIRIVTEVVVRCIIDLLGIIGFGFSSPPSLSLFLYKFIIKSIPVKAYRDFLFWNTQAELVPSPSLQVEGEEVIEKSREHSMSLPLLIMNSA